jgi:hypothetical protein
LKRHASLRYLTCPLLSVVPYSQSQEGLGTSDVKPSPRGVPKALKLDARLVAVSILGSAFLPILLVIALTVPDPPPLARKVFQTILALAAAGVAAIIPGLFNVKLTGFINAGGALGVFAVVYFFNPAEAAVNVAKSIYRPPEAQTRELIELTEHLVQLQDERMAAGTGTLEEMIDTHRRLVNRKLAASFTSEERLAVWEEAAKVAKDIASEQEARFEAGTVPSVYKEEGSEYQKEVELEYARAKFEAQQ